MNNFSISDLESAVMGKIREIFTGEKVGIYSNRPKATRQTEDAFFVVKVADALVDEWSYGSCTLGVDIFAKDAETLKNGKRLEYLQTKFLSSMPLSLTTSKNSYEFDNAPSILGDSPDDYGYHARLINIKTIIKVS